jgi:hypothetical protein
LKIKTILITCVLTFILAINNSHAGIIDFELGLDSRFEYTEVVSFNHYVNPSSGYFQMNEITGSTNTVFNPNGKSPSTFALNGDGTFDLDSFLIAGAWGSQTLFVEALLDDSVIYSGSIFVNNVSVSTFNANWTGIDAFRITTGIDYVKDPLIDSGSGQHWVLDNISVNNLTVIPVPEPTSLALFSLVFLLVARSLRAAKQ